MDSVKVRGKNKRSKVKQPSRRPRGRPMKPFHELAKVKRGTSNRQHQIQRLQSRWSLTELERLPEELLEQIFFYAEEISLPRASLHIGKKLSSERVYRKILIRAFGERRDRDVSSQKQQDLQCAILGAKWCTVNRIKFALPAMAKFTLTLAWQSCCQHNESLQDRKVVWPLPEDSEAPETEVEKHFTAKYDESPLRFVCSCGPAMSEGKEFPVFQVQTIPESVIRRSSQSIEGLEMLRLVRQGWRRGWKFCNRFESPDNVPDPQAIFQAMAQTIIEDNMLALQTLVELAAIVHMPSLYETSRARVEFPDDLPLPAELFQNAVQSSRATEFLQILLRLGPKSLPRNDAKITRWATNVRDEGGKDASFANWLLDIMEQGLPQDDVLFKYGRPNRTLLPSLLPVFQTARTFDVECGYDLSIFDYNDTRRYIWFV